MDMKIDTDDYLTTAEFAELVGAPNADYIKTYCRRKVIAAKKQFGRWIIPVSEVEKFTSAIRKPGPKPKSF